MVVLRGKVAVMLVFFIGAFMGLSSQQPSLTEWTDYPRNPVFNPGKAYYPTVLYDANAFGEVVGGTYAEAPYYKMWYSDGGGIASAYSEDGITWQQYGHLTTISIFAHHSRVIYDRNGFGGGNIKYKMWYEDTRYLYSIDAIRYIESSDGFSWANDKVITQNDSAWLVKDFGTNWNRGSYGPMHVIFNSGATNTGSHPFDYSYVMYFDGTTGGVEQVGLAYSEDGITDWKLYGTSPILPLGSSGSWDDNYACYGTVLFFDGLWHMWYSGGRTGGGGGMGTKGIGYATSPDGITWTKYAKNPLKSLGGFGTFGGVGNTGTWNEFKNYTSTVLYDAARFSGHGEACEFKMWRSGVTPEPADKKSIGYASLCLPPSTGNRKRILSYFSLRPLAENQIGNADGKKTEVENLLKLAQERGLDTAQCKAFYENGLKYMVEAKKFLAGENWAAANTYAIYAEREFRKAHDCLKALMG